MNPFQPFLDQQGFVVLDGAMATELERRGADLEGSMWASKFVLDDPGLVQRLHEDYLGAGADVIMTASYQATPQSAPRVGLTESEVESLLRDSVSLAVRARETWETHASDPGRLRPLIAASIGPYATYLADGSEYTGNYDLTVEELKDFHRPRMRILDDTDIDLFAFETVPRRREAVALIELLAEFPHRQAWLAFSCKDEVHVSHGERFDECVALARGNPQIAAVGVNCSPPHIISGLLSSVVDCDMPRIAYPNSGETWHSNESRWSAPESEEPPLVDLAREWLSAGATIIGGCCRITVEDIAALKAGLMA